MRSKGQDRFVDLLLPKADVRGCRLDAPVAEGALGLDEVPAQARVDPVGEGLSPHPAAGVRRGRGRGEPPLGPSVQHGGGAASVSALMPRTEPRPDPLRVERKLRLALAWGPVHRHRLHASPFSMWLWDMGARVR